jgi:hypothetical protein
MLRIDLEVLVSAGVASPAVDDLAHGVHGWRFPQAHGPCTVVLGIRTVQRHPRGKLREGLAGTAPEAIGIRDVGMATM